MYRRYRLKLWAKAGLVLIVPLAAYALVIALVFPQTGFWGYFLWALGIVFSWFGFWAGIAQLLGSSLPQWIGWDLLRVIHAFDAMTRRTMSSIRDTLPVLDRRIERVEIEEAWDLLAEGHPVLVTGESGSGKSGVAAALVRKAQEAGMLALFLDTRNYSPTVSSFGDLEKYVMVRSPLRDCLETISRKVGPCLLVIDQLDSAVGTQALQVSTELLAHAALVRQVYVVAVGCVLDTPEYQAVADLRFHVVSCNPVPREIVLPTLQALGVDDPPDTLLALSDNLFNLSLIAQLSGEGKTDGATQEVALLEALSKALIGREGAEFAETAGTLAYENMNVGRANFVLPRDQKAVCQKLQGRGIIVPTQDSRYRFRHEQFLYYFFARDVIERDLEPEAILVRLAGRYAESAFVWLVRLYRYRRSARLARFLRVALHQNSALTFYEKASILDQVVAWDDIDGQPSVVEAITSSLWADASLRRYFFQHLAESKNAHWFHPLRVSGFFDAAPEPIRDGNTVSYPYWQALTYVVAVAPLLPQQVVEVAQGLHAKGPCTLMELVRVTRAMPPEVASGMVPAITRWVQEGMKVERSIVSLAKDLGERGQWEAALGLIDLIMSPEEEHASDEMRQSIFFTPRATGKADEHVVRTFVEQELPFFVEQRPVEVLRIIQKNLEAALSIETRGGADTSHGWRPAIESHEQNLDDGTIKDLLVEAAVQALSRIAESSMAEGKTILEDYLEHSYSIFTRIAIHIIRQYPQQWPDLLARLFEEARYLEEPDFHHEYWWLMHDTCGVIESRVRESFIRRVFSRLPTDELPGDGEYHGRRYWVIKQLWAIEPGLLTDAQREVVQALVGKYRPPDHPDFLSYSHVTGGWVTSMSPTDVAQLSPEETLAELVKPLPFSSLDGPSQEGLAKALKEAISSMPERYALAAPRFLAPDIQPIHAHHAVLGFHEAWKADRPFDWEPVMTLFELISRTMPPGRTGSEPADMSSDYWDQTYASARSAVADLLYAATARDDRALPPELLTRARSVLLALCDDPNPSPEYEKRFGSQYPRRWLDVSLNVTRARAVEALLQYALHVARNRADVEEKTSSLGPRWEPEVRAKLTERLDRQVDLSLAVHCLFGKYLPNLYYLDEEWLLGHLEDIFPLQPELADYWEAAWEGYLSGGGVYQYLYSVLRPYYRHALEQIAVGSEGKAGSGFAVARLSRHLALLYWHGAESLQEGSLVRLFFASAPDDLRAGFVAGLENNLANQQSGPDSPQWQRVKALWEWRFDTIGNATATKGEMASFVKEVGAYAGWVPYIPKSELKGTYPMIEVGVLAADEWKATKALEFFSSAGADHTPFATTLLEKLVIQNRGPWFLLNREETVYEILRAALRSGNGEARASAVRVINLLGQRGDEQYRPLLKEVQNHDS